MCLKSDRLEIGLSIHVAFNMLLHAGVLYCVHTVFLYACKYMLITELLNTNLDKIYGVVQNIKHRDC